VKPPPKDLVASIQVRLLQHSRTLGVDHQLTLVRFAGERLLYRLAASEYAGKFILKGAALMLLWLGEKIRPTKDIDLLGSGDTSAEELKRVFMALCEQQIVGDGLDFLPHTVQAESIREQQDYGGMRVTLTAKLGKIKIPLQVDVGVGDAVVPPPETLDYPGLLDLPRARVRAYRPETSIAEKCEAMVTLAQANSRMKDFWDIYSLALAKSFEGDVLRAAVAATFSRRQTAIPAALPMALTNEFSADAQKQTQWDAFVRRNRFSDAPPSLDQVVAKLAEFLGPVLEAVAADRPWPRNWKSAGPWSADR
jgi:predicted nucleotidyltransferase component of viral defense system